MKKLGMTIVLLVVSSILTGCKTEKVDGDVEVAVFESELEQGVRSFKDSMSFIDKEGFVVEFNYGMETETKREISIDLDLNQADVNYYFDYHTKIDDKYHIIIRRITNIGETDERRFFLYKENDSAELELIYEDILLIQGDNEYLYLVKKVNKDIYMVKTDFDLNIIAEKKIFETKENIRNMRSVNFLTISNEYIYIHLEDNFFMKLDKNLNIVFTNTELSNSCFEHYDEYNSDDSRFTDVTDDYIELHGKGYICKYNNDGELVTYEKMFDKSKGGYSDKFVFKTKEHYYVIYDYSPLYGSSCRIQKWTLDYEKVETRMLDEGGCGYYRTAMLYDNYIYALHGERGIERVTLF